MPENADQQSTTSAGGCHTAQYDVLLVAFSLLLYPGLF